MPANVCPHCGDPLSGAEVTEERCYHCGKALPPGYADRLAVEEVVEAAPHRFRPEPWFYGFLEVVANVVMTLATLGFLTLLVLSLYVIAKTDLAWVGFTGIVYALIGVVSVFFWGCTIRLFVDIGRNLREVSQNTRR